MAIVVTLLATSSALLTPSMPHPRCTALRTLTPLLELQEEPPPPPPPPFTTNDAALGGGLYLLLNLLLIETASIVAPSDFGAIALARGAACAIFVALQSTAGLPPAEWLSPQQADAAAATTRRHTPVPRPRHVRDTSRRLTPPSQPRSAPPGPRAEAGYSGRSLQR